MPSKFLNISTDNTLGGSSSSDEVVSSQKAIKEYIDDNTAPAGSYLTTNTTQSIDQSAVKTFNGRVNFIGTGDANAIYLTTDTRIDVYGTSRTVLGFANGTFLINNSAYPLNLRGGGARPAWNGTSYLALTSDIGNATLTIQKNGTAVDTFTANATSDKTINITVPTKTSDLTNDDGFITGINSSDVTTALGYTPYDASNPNGYTSNTGTVTSVNNVSPVNGNVSLSIPTVNNPTITITQGGITKGSFTLNQSTGDTIALDAGGGGGSVDIDGISITKNGDDELQTVGVIDQNNTSSAIKTWTGTKAQYDAIVSKDANTLYNITDDANPTLSLLESIYPVGSVYIGTMSVCPLSALFGTWTLVSTKILTDIPATLEAKGNGITLGLTNGSSDVGLYYSSGVVMRSAAYGQNIGYAGGSNTNPGTSSLGVTTDSTKSGIVADTNATSLTVNVWERTA